MYKFLIEKQMLLSSLIFNKGNAAVPNLYNLHSILFNKIDSNFVLLKQDLTFAEEIRLLQQTSKGDSLYCNRNAMHRNGHTIQENYSINVYVMVSQTFLGMANFAT